MRVLDLFSGIGGFSLGLQMAGGFRTVQFCEIEPWCRQVLAKNFPGVPIHDDIRSFQPAAGIADIVVGGFPCQPFSHAGKRRGTEDDRDLWPEMRRVIAAVRPAWVIGENVAGFVNMELDRSLSDLEALGYACQAFVIPACAVDAPHRRDRVWIVGYTDRHGEPALPVDAEASGRQDVGHSLRDGCEAGDRGRALPDGDGVGASSTAGWQEQQPGAFGAGAVADASSGRRSPEFNPRSGGTAASGRQGDAQSGGADVADTDGAGQRAGGRGRVDSAGHAGPQPDLGCQAPADAGGARLQDGRPGGLEAQAAYRSGHGHLRSRWSPEPGVGRVAHGIPRRVDRLRGLGNAVVPQVVAEIGRAIMSASR